MHQAVTGEGRGLDKSVTGLAQIAHIPPKNSMNHNAVVRCKIPIISRAVLLSIDVSDEKIPHATTDCEGCKKRCMYADAHEHHDTDTSLTTLPTLLDL